MYLKNLHFSSLIKQVKYHNVFIYCIKYKSSLAKLAAEYTDYIFAERYDTKQSDVEALVILEIWGMWSTPLLTSLPGPLWPRVVAPNRVLSMGQIVLNNMPILN